MRFSPQNTPRIPQNIKTSSVVLQEHRTWRLPWTMELTQRLLNPCLVRLETTKKRRPHPLRTLCTQKQYPRGMGARLKVTRWKKQKWTLLCPVPLIPPRRDSSGSPAHPQLWTTPAGDRNPVSATNCLTSMQMHLQLYCTPVHTFELLKSVIQTFQETYLYEYTCPQSGNREVIVTGC